MVLYLFYEITVIVEILLVSFFVILLAFFL